MDNPTPYQRGKWNDKRVLKRLRDVLEAVKAPNGVSTIETVRAYLSEAKTCNRLTRAVIGAILVPNPDPEEGDDGYQAEARQDALDALDWADRWVLVRNREDWGPQAHDYLGRLPDSPVSETERTQNAKRES